MDGINGKIFEEGITNSDLSATSGEFPFGLGDDSRSGQGIFGRGGRDIG
jgi:hypothetical protein